MNNSGSERFRFLAATAGSSNAVWVLNNNTSDGQSANFGNGTLYFGALSGNGQFRQDTSGTTTLEIGALGLDSTFSGIIYQAGGGDSFAVNKVGAGTLTFAGANNYSGLTAVKQGRLLINQNQTGSGGFTVSGGATLGITNAVLSNMADLGALTLSAGATLEFQNVSNLTAALADTTSLTVSGTCTVLITGTNYLAVGNTYPLVSYSGSLAGSFANFKLQMPVGWAGVLVSNTAQMDLTVVATPTTPAGLTGTAGNAQATFTWYAATNATGYNLKRSTISGGPYTNVVSNWSVTNFTSTGLSNGTLYYFVVSATNAAAAVESANSAAVGLRPLATNSPALSLAVNNGQLQLNWPQDHTGWTLQAQTNSLKTGLGTNWVTVSGSTATNQVGIPINSTNGGVFLRLVDP